MDRNCSSDKVLLRIFDAQNTLLQTTSAPKGMRLYSALTEAGIRIQAPCGGAGRCGKCVVLVNGKEELSCQYMINEDLDIQIPEVHFSGVEPTVSVLKLPEAGLRRVGFAVDIGTTTVGAYMADLDTGAILAEAYGLNPQSRFGADVISRIDFASRSEGAARCLQDCITSCLNQIFQSSLVQTGISADMVETAVIAANTTMLHLLTGAPCGGLGQAPYTPHFINMVRQPGKKLGFAAIPEADMILLPSISAFVGADIVAGILAEGLYKASRRVLFIDMGTNGELILADRGKLYAASTACGPAFEGANISCGIGGVPGAICKIQIDQALRYETIGGKAPIGICGSGLIDLIAELLRRGIIDETGRLLPPDEAEPDALSAAALLRRLHIDEKTGKVYFTVAEEAPDRAYLASGDVRMFQNAKAAVLAGVQVMVKAAGLEPEEVDEVVLAGGFGSHINVANTVKSGILPAAFRDRCRFAGNTALQGALLALLDPALLHAAAESAQRAQLIELTADEAFSDFYIESMLFA